MKFNFVKRAAQCVNWALLEKNYIYESLYESSAMDSALLFCWREKPYRFSYFSVSVDRS